MRPQSSALLQPVPLSDHPLVTETPPAALGDGLTPSSLHYVRHHFDTLRIDPHDWNLQVTGLVDRPLSLSLDAVQTLPPKTLAVTLECAGNGRSRFQPPAEGNQFGQGAVSTAEWAGVPLATVLDAAGVQPRATSVWFEGADRGPQGKWGEQPYGRGLSLQHAVHPDVLLAYRMNGEALTAEHGAPLRLIVPGWYGVASVKWLAHVRVADRPYEGYFHVERYVLKVPGQEQHTPLGNIKVKSLIVAPAAGAKLPTGTLAVEGKAWAGERAVAKVEFSADGGRTWMPAEVEPQRARYAWQSWRISRAIHEPGRYRLVSRATDSAGETQPERPKWNVHGYGNNAWETVEIEVFG